MSESKKSHRWGLEHWQTVFAGALVVVGVVYTIAALAQWRSMNQQARVTSQQLEVMRSEIEDTKLSRSADLILRYGQLLDKQPNPRLRIAIESGKPILKAHGGKFSEDELESYLGIFDNLSDLYEKGMINKDLFYNEYSYDAVKLYDNPEVQSYLKELRKNEDEDDFFIGVDKLAQQMKVYPNPALKH